MAHTALGGGGGGYESLASDPALRAAVSIEEKNRSEEHWKATHAGTNPSVAQLLVHWAIRRLCGVVVSSGSRAHILELVSAVFNTSSYAAVRKTSEKTLSIIDEIPLSRNRRRHNPPPFAFLFQKADEFEQ